MGEHNSNDDYWRWNVFKLLRRKIFTSDSLLTKWPWENTTNNTNITDIMLEIGTRAIIQNSTKCIASGAFSQNVEIDCSNVTPEVVKLFLNSPACLACKKTQPNCPMCYACVATDIDQIGALRISSTCQMDAAVAGSVKNSVEQAIQQSMTQKDDVLGEFMKRTPTGSSESNYQKLNMRTRLDSLFSVDVLQEAVATVQANQNVKLTGTGVVSGITQRLAVSLITETLAKSSAMVEFTNEVKALSQQDQTDETTGPLNVISDMFSNPTFLIILGIVVLVGGFLFFKSSGGSNKRD